MMEVTHSGYLWVEEHVSIDIDIISFIIGIPYRGDNPMHYLDDKTKENALVEEMKKTYDTKRGYCRKII
jgi:hypothetical protein